MPNPEQFQALLDVLEEMTAATVRDLEDRVHRLLSEYWETKRVCGRKLVSSALLDAVSAAAGYPQEEESS